MGCILKVGEDSSRGEEEEGAAESFKEGFG